MSQASEIPNNLRWSIKNSRKSSQMTPRNTVTQQNRPSLPSEGTRKNVAGEEGSWWRKFLAKSSFQPFSSGTKLLLGGIPAIVKVPHHTNAGARRLMGWGKVTLEDTVRIAGLRFPDHGVPMHWLQHTPRDWLKLGETSYFELREQGRWFEGKAQPEEVCPVKTGRLTWEY